MAYNIEAFRIRDEEFSGYSIADTKSENKERIENLSKINIFIGANNSGKSRFLRTLFSKEDLAYRTRNVNLNAVNELISNTLNTLVTIQEGASYKDITTLPDDFSKLLAMSKFRDQEAIV